MSLVESEKEWGVWGLRSERCEIIVIVFDFVIFYWESTIEHKNVVGLQGQCRENKTSACACPCSLFGMYVLGDSFIYSQIFILCLLF